MILSETDNKIYNKLLQQLPHRTVLRPAAAILFCGIPGSGKTTLALRLARDLQAQYMQNDTTRAIAQQLGLRDYDIHPVNRAVVETIVANDANKLIVFDASIDRVWRDALAHYKKLGLTPIIIRIHIDPNEAIARLQKRGRHDDTILIAETSARQAQFDACQKELPATITVQAPFDYQVVLRAVQQQLTRL